MERNIYSRTKVSIRLLDAVIVLGLFAIALVTVYLSLTGGFDIEFDTGGGSPVASQRLRYGEVIEEPAAPTREGYIFLGWYEDEALTREIDFSSAVATGSKTVYACWQEIK